MNEHSSKHHVRNVVLPSGRTIQVVRFEDELQHAAPRLHVCPECECDLVQPLSWAEVRPGQWELSLRCPNCEWTGDGVYAHDAVERLEDKFDEGVATVLADLKRLAHANMEDEVDRFVAALNAGLILPEDF
jgi:hypothetical protein